MKELAVSSVSLPGSANDYYLNIMALTPKEQVQAQATDQASQIPSVASYFVWAPMAVFIMLFIAVFGLMIAGKVMTFKRTVSAMMLALVLAAIPYITGQINTGFSTSTKAGPEEFPKNVEIKRLTPSSATVVWMTDVALTGAVRYGATPLDELMTKVLIADSGQKTTIHTVELSGLVPGKTYDLEIFSGKTWYNNSGTNLQFTPE